MDKNLDKLSEWHSKASHLATVREIREVVLVATLLDERPQLREWLAELLSLEKVMLLRLRDEDKPALSESLWLDQSWSWKETYKAMKATGRLREAVEVELWSVRAKKLVRELLGANLSVIEDSESEDDE